MSTILLVPWVIYGYKHPDQRFFGLCQTKRSLLVLLGIEILYWIVLMLLVGRTDTGTTGEGSFAWRFLLLYEKGIIPVWWLAGKINPSLADKVDADYKILYLVAALIMDYIFLFIISPRVPQLLKRKERVQKSSE